MNKKSNIAQAFIGVLALSVSVLPAAALARDSEDSGTALPVTITTHVDAEGRGTSVNSTTTAGMHITGDENDNSDENTQDEEASSTKHHQEGEHQSLNSRHESDDSDTEIDIDQDSLDEASSTIDAPEQVSSHDDLRSFLAHILKDDERISDVHVSSSTIETHYEMPAKFLWAIPVNLAADVSVASDGSVTVTYPWYAFLFAKHDSDLAAQLQQSAAATGASASLSANAQAHLLNLVFSVLKSSAQQ